MQGAAGGGGTVFQRHSGQSCARRAFPVGLDAAIAAGLEFPGDVLSVAYTAAGRSR